MSEQAPWDDEKIKAVTEKYDWDIALTDLLLEGWTADLVQLLNSDRPVPPQVRRYLAALLEGTVKLPDGRGKKNTALSPSDKERMRVALFKLYSYTETVLIFADQLADERGEEVIDLRRYMEKTRRDGLKKIAEHFRLSEHTVRQYHDAKNTINWAWCYAGKNEIQNSEGKLLPGLLGKPQDLQRFAIDNARAYLQYPELFFDPLTE